MKTLKEYIIKEEDASRILNDDEIDFNSPVMYSIYGDSEGPWYFGYKLKEKHAGKYQGVVSPCGKNGIKQPTYPKLIIDFDKFDTKNLKNNK